MLKKFITRNAHFKFISIALFIILVTNCTKDPLINQDVDYQKLNEAFSLAKQINNLKSLVVFHEDIIIKEEYYGTGGADARHDVRSVTKSVVSILVGIAIDKGYIHSIEQTIGEFIDSQTYSITSEKAAIKIRDLLTMTSGFEWDELTSNDVYNNWVLAENQVQYLLDKPLINNPGEYFTYNTAALHLLSVIITNATGMNTRDFALEYLFEPLGIEEIEWETDNQGFYNGGAGLEITPHDMIKIGQLILNHGVYNGNLIVSSNYIDQSVQSKISTNSTMYFGTNYGYCWWLGQSENRDFAFANGYGGQFIVVIPEINLIVVATNQWSGVGATVANDQWYRTLDIIINRIFPAFN